MTPMQFSNQSLFDFSSPALLKNLYGLGAALMAVSVLYLLAANWFWFTKTTQLAIPQILLVITAFVSTLKTISQTTQQILHTISGVMLGLVLAVIGQVYQTGADSYLLFGLWSLLLLGWFYQKNIGIFTVFCITSQLAVWLFFQQITLKNINDYYMVAWHIISLLQFLVMVKFYPALRYVFIGLFAMISLMSVFLWEQKGGINAYALGVILTPLLAVIYFKKRQEQMGISLSLSVLATGLFLWFLVAYFDGNVWYHFFIMALMTLAWFSVVSWLLLKLFPKGKFHRIPLMVGAWLAGIIFSILFLVFWEALSFFLGFLALIGSFFILHNLPTSIKGQDFIRQLAYCLMVCGQVAFLTHLGLKTDSLQSVLVAQLVIACATLWLRPHWLLLYIQCFGVFALLCAVVIEPVYIQSLISLSSKLSILAIIGLSAIFLLPLAKRDHYERGLWFWLGSVLLTIKFLSVILVDNFYHEPSLATEFGFVEKILMAMLCLWVIWRFWSNTLAKTIQIAFAILAVLLVALGYSEVFWLLMGLLFAISQKDNLLYGVYLLSFAVFLSYVYYSLETTFIIKSMTIFLSGVVFFMMAWLLQKNRQLLGVS